MKIIENLDLTQYNSYKIQAHCKRAYFPEREEDIVSFFSEKHSKKIILGAGYNVIFSKNFYTDNFLIFSGTYNSIKLLGETKLLCQAGVNMKQLTSYALNHSLKGVEIFYDIPSSLGGAVVMNAGASGEDIAGILERVWYYDPKTKLIHEKGKEEIDFIYRNSFFQRNPELVISRILLKLEKGNVQQIRNKMLETEKARHHKQPRNFPNAGSVFKRPEGYYVGAIIEELGLKGFAIGGAKISEKHGGFIVNFNKATGNDILQIINHVQNKVQQKYGFKLEVEQRVL